MFTVVYVSTAAESFKEEELEKILEVSRRKNAALGITGLLLYKDGTFMQFLEGPKEPVLKLLSVIRDDPRHHSMIVISQEEHREREFESWSMAFERLYPKEEPAPAGFTDVWELPFSCDEYLSEPTRAMEFLLSFKERVR